MEHQYPNRRSVRLPVFDYGNTGAYFVTVCAQNRAAIFGRIEHGVMCLNALGARTWWEWRQTFEKRADFSPGAFVVMPNHWHGVIHICRQPGEHYDTARIESFGSSKKDTIATVLKGIKSAVTSYAIHELTWEGRLWQRGFHDHIIRDEQEYRRIETYILNNVRNWQDDRFSR